MSQVFATGSQHGLRYIEEDDFGVTPAGNVKALRHTSTGLAVTKDTFQSEELRSDRQIADFQHGAIQAAGDVGFEFSFAEYDDLLEGALFGEWVGDVLKAGTTRHSYSMRRRFDDIGVEGRFRGVMVNTFSLSIPANAMVTGSFGLIGKEGEYADQASEAAIDASEAYSPFDSFTGEIKEGNATIAVVTSLEFVLANGLEPAFVVGANTTPRITSGRSNLTGTVSAYFANRIMLDKFIAETESSIELTLEQGNVDYEILIPRLKYSGGDNPAVGEGPIVIAMPFQAMRDSVEETNLVITRNEVT